MTVADGLTARKPGSVQAPTTLVSNVALPVMLCCCRTVLYTEERRLSCQVS